MKASDKRLILWAIGILLTTACITTTAVPTIDMAVVQTYTAQTVIAALTLTSQVASPTPTPQAVPPTETEAPQPSPTSTLADTPLPPSPTPLPLPAGSTLSPTPDTGVRLEIDDFEHGGYWYTNTTANYSLAYEQGGYRIRNGMQPGILYSVRTVELESVRIEVDAHAIEAPDGSFWGLTCRHVDGDSYYALGIGPDGFYGIGKMKGGIFQYLARNTTTDKDIFKKDEYGFLRLRADCIGSTLTLYANGTFLMQVQDDEYKSGEVGLVVRHVSTDTWTDLLFDNFAIWQPGN